MLSTIILIGQRTVTTPLVSIVSKTQLRTKWGTLRDLTMFTIIVIERQARVIARTGNAILCTVGARGPNTHGAESLECEDKWALWRKYGLVDP